MACVYRLPRHWRRGAQVSRANDLLKALNGRDGELDSCVECMDEAELRASIRELIGHHATSRREHFAGLAPHEPQPWFKPVMPVTRPKYPQWSSIENEAVREDVRAAIDCYTDPTTAEGAAFIEHQNEMFAAGTAWDAEYEKQRYVQWPAAWADAVITDLAKPVQS
jgi:hypothetical protein